VQEINRRVVLSRPVQGVPVASDFEIAETPIAKPFQGEMLLRHIYLSLDPWQRSAIAGRHSADGAPLRSGDMPPGEVIGEVVESHHPKAQPGDYVRFMGGWQEYSVALGEDVIKLDPEQAPLSTYLGVLGMPGLTAWASVTQLAKVQSGQTLLVSAALGPVGSTVGQIATKLGATAIGLAGSDEKCRRVIEETGFAACINYKSDDYPESLRSAVPNGVDVYHDNVGGQMLIDAINVMNDYGTVVLCGLISQYNDASAAVNLPMALPIMKRLTMKGLVVYDYNDRQQEFFDLVAPWVQDGSVKYVEDRATEIISTGGHFARLMRGENTGKSLVVLGPERVG